MEVSTPASIHGSPQSVAEAPISGGTTALAYIGGVLFVNVGFSHRPDLDAFWSLLVGGVLALRDLAQRHWGHGVLLLMLAGGLISLSLRARARP